MSTEREQAESAPIIAELGSTGLKRAGTQLLEEWHPHLSGRRAMRIFREMGDNEPTIAGAKLAIESLVRQVEWKVEPADESDEAQAVADFVEECRHDMEHTWSDFVSEALSMMDFGFSVFEVVYKFRRGRHKDIGQINSRHSDGMIGWRKFGIRAQDTIEEWCFGPDGSVMGFWQQAAPDYDRIFIPDERTLHFKLRGHKSNPEGRSLYRAAYSSYYYAKRLRELEAIGAERDLAGLPVMELPARMMVPGATQYASVRSDWETKIQKIRRGQYEGLVLPCETDEKGNPTGYKFRLVQSAGQKAFPINDIIKRYESRMLVSMLSEFLLLGMDKVGSFALSSDKTDLFALAVEAIICALEEVITNKAIADLCRLNGFDEPLFPTLSHGELEKENIQLLAQNIATAQSFGGMGWSDEDEDWLREKLGAPKRSEGAERSQPMSEEQPPEEPSLSDSQLAT